ncbi:uncharacterized protein ARMOST_20333 [Armillaria ostoyae]|uniref:Uncharacterized protein n=1 Tax=Armillaria ostoyae TaxID=47428 RepID=A0A284S733_ARMOS|nr:uncharacterized protein ARMOST_20333 [Armillaria ostoyae]
MSDIYMKTVDKVFEVYHHWAKGSHLPWMEAWLQGFHIEHRKGRMFTYDFVDKETREYYKTYHWSLSLKEEPVLPRRNPDVVEELTREEEAYRTQHENQMRGLWSKVSFSGAVQDAFLAWFASSGLAERSWTPERGRWTQEYFNKLPAEIRALFKQEAVAEKERTMEAKKKGRREKAEPALEGPSVSSGVEGDEVMLEGASSVIPMAALTPEEVARLNYGWNKDPRPKDWCDASGGKGHSKAMELFVVFAKTCYTPEEMRAHAIEKPDDTEATSSASGSDNAGVPDLDDVMDDAAVEERSKKKWKRSKKAKDKDSEIADDGHPVKRGKTKPLQDVTNKAILGGGLNDKPSPGRAQSEFGGDSTNSNSPQGSPLPSPPGSPPAPLQPTSLDRMTTTPPFLLTVVDLALLERECWDEWFEELKNYLEGYKLGERWNNVLGCWTVWEGRGGFKDLKGAKNRLPSNGRPAEVAAWIKFYRRIKLTIAPAEVRRFADKWWSWWKGMQLEWHNVGDVEGPLRDEFRGELGRDWEVLAKRGQNRHVSPLASLAWWGDSVGDDVEMQREWAWAVEECHHTLLNLLACTS